MSSKEWEKWADTDPLFAAASWQGRERKGPCPWAAEDFYKLGESDWTDFRRQWERYGVDKQSCLEVGCGAGRITMQLATYFNEVHALDISEKMIEYAKQHITNPSVVFYLSDGINIPLHDQSITSVFSSHVFQHFQSLSVASKYFAEIARVLKPDGSLMIHLPIYKWPSMSKSFSQLYAISKQARDIKVFMKGLAMQFGMAKPIMRALYYPVEFLYEELPGVGFDDIEISIFTTKSNNDPHSFVFARRKVPLLSQPNSDSASRNACR